MLIGSLFTIDDGTTYKYIIGKCFKNVTDESLPGWLWSPLFDEEEELDFRNENIPNCGKASLLPNKKIKLSVALIIV